MWEVRELTMRGVKRNYVQILPVSKPNQQPLSGTFIQILAHSVEKDAE
jgi:hypothetical protein